MLCIASISLTGQGYNDVGTVTGHVVIRNHPTLGKTPCGNCEFLMQRLDCRRCLIYVKTNSEGDYTVRIGMGRWRIIRYEKREGLTEADMLPKDQVREFNLQSPRGELKFDIVTIVLP